MTWLCLIIGVSSFGFSLLLLINLRRMRRLPPGNAGSDPCSDKLSVIIPARNEEEMLETCLRSILQQDDLDLEIVVVNDHSTDRTGEIAESVARTDPRVRVLHNPSIEPGWLGKQNAMQKALETVDSRYVLFSDADMVHTLGCIAAGWSELRRRDLGLVSLMPSFEFHGFWEHVLIPGYMGWMGFNLGPAVEDPNSRAAVAAGAFTLVRVDALEKAGGLDAIKSEVLDDVELGRRFKKERIPVGLYLATGRLKVRLFKNGTQAFWGMTKNILAAAPGGLAGTLALALVSIPTYWLPPASILLSLVRGAPWLLAASLFAFASQYAGILLLRRFLHFHPLRLLGFFLQPLPSACCIARALYYRLVHGAVRWRGRSLPVR